MNGYYARGTVGHLVITFRADEQTPAEYRHHDGRTQRWPSGVPIPTPPYRGQLCGIPGEFADDGRTWLIRAPWPVPPDPGPPWAQELGRKLDEIKALLSLTE